VKKDIAKLPDTKLDNSLKKHVNTESKIESNPKKMVEFKVEEINDNGLLKTEAKVENRKFSILDVPASASAPNKELRGRNKAYLIIANSEYMKHNIALCPSKLE
jgi:hypothetical protein